MKKAEGFHSLARDYTERLHQASLTIPLDAVATLAEALLECWQRQRQVFIFGNGGSAGNAIHLANDFIYGISKRMGSGIRMHALPANQSMITCLANDVGYESVFSHQMSVFAQSGDIAIALSGSGNSPNILKALEYCSEHSIKSFAILGYGGGKAKDLCDVAIHIPINDMQISEDLQLVVGHMLMQWLCASHDPSSLIG